MSIKKWIPACIVAVSLVGLSTAAFAVDFKPFTQVENVCPECEQPKADVVSMSSGDKFRGTVVAENSAFYTVVRYGEVRAVPRSDVQSIAWADGSKPSGLMNKDQILLNSGHVLSGTIVDEKDKPSFFQIKSSFSDFTYTVAKSEVQTAYKNGSEYSFTAGEKW
jgi:hypothetical protein